MFKKFTNEDISGQTQVKSSVQRGIKAKISEQYPLLEGEVLDTILPKKASMYAVKWYECGPWNWAFTSDIDADITLFSPFIMQFGQSCSSNNRFATLVLQPL